MRKSLILTTTAVAMLSGCGDGAATIPPQNQAPPKGSVPMADEGKVKTEKEQRRKDRGRGDYEEEKK